MFRDSVPSSFFTTTHVRRKILESNIPQNTAYRKNNHQASVVFNFVRNWYESRKSFWFSSLERLDQYFIFYSIMNIWNCNTDLIIFVLKFQLICRIKYSANPRIKYSSNTTLHSLKQYSRIKYSTKYSIQKKRKKTPNFSCFYSYPQYIM